MTHVLALLSVLVALCLPGTGAASQTYSFLADHVHNGVVDYSALKKDPRLNAAAKELSETRLSEFSKAPKEAMAFWINVYNVFTLKLICDNWPVKSILDLDNGKVWDRLWIRVDGKTYSLNQIENTILRPMGDPRIHFALVCAAKSCPPLRSEAYSAGQLDSQLNDQGKAFVANASLNRFSAADQRARVSKIFEWYGSDFGSKTADLVRALAPYAPPAAQSSMKAAPAGSGLH